MPWYIHLYNLCWIGVLSVIALNFGFLAVYAALTVIAAIALIYIG